MGAFAPAFGSIDAHNHLFKTKYQTFIRSDLVFPDRGSYVGLSNYKGAKGGMHRYDECKF
jgi:hypothetical protein